MHWYSVRSSFSWWAVCGRWQAKQVWPSFFLTIPYLFGTAPPLRCSAWRFTVPIRKPVSSVCGLVNVSRSWQPRQSSACLGSKSASRSMEEVLREQAAFFEACGRWQSLQPSSSAAWVTLPLNSGLAAWHFSQSALPAATRSFLFCEPWGLWQLVHLPSLTGGVDRRPLGHVVVALATEGGALPDEHELLLVLVVEVAGGAIPRRSRVVGELERFHLARKVVVALEAGRILGAGRATGPSTHRR